MVSPRRSYVFHGSFILCIFLLQWFQSRTYPEAFVLLGIAGIIGIIGILFVKARTIVITTVAATLGTALALASVARTTHVPTDLTIDTYATGEQHVTLRGRIAAEPDRRPMQTKYTIAAAELETASGTIITPVTGRVLATDHSGWPQYMYGDDVEIRGKLQRPGLIEDFHYDRYLSRYNMYSVIYSAGVELRKPHDPRTILGTLYTIKDGFEEQINRLYAEPHASFMAGLLTGSRRGIPRDLLDDFNRTGLTHIIAISGYNITIVIGIIALFLFWLPLKIRFIPAVLAIIAFTLLVGASAAVVRASIMGILGLLALQTGRQRHARLAILWTLFLMLLWNPKYLWYDAGFQLSFLAVIGLSELSPLMDRWFHRVPTTLKIRDALQATIAAQLSAVPLTAILFGRFPLAAPLANVLSALAVPFAMLFGFLGVALSFLWFPIGQTVAYLGWGCLQWVILVAETLSRLPFASIETPQMNVGIVVVYYAILVGWIVYTSRRNSDCALLVTTDTSSPSDSLGATAPPLPSEVPSP